MPLIRILAAVLGLVLGLMWFFPILPSGDGPYQTMNWISRIKEGQLPGRDFDVFHGLGVLWFHAVLALPASTARGVIYVHAMGSVIAQFLLWMAVFQSQERTWGKSLWCSAALCGLVALSAGVPLANFNTLLAAGHSMIGARVALTLVVLFIAHLLTSSGRIKGWYCSIVMGTAAGLGAWISTDQATAATMMAVAYTFFGALSVKGSWPVRLLQACLAAAGAGVIAVFAYLFLVWLATEGSPERTLAYWWKYIPAVQFSYFGGAPDPFFRTLKDLLNPGLLVFLGVSASMHLVGFRWRRPGQTPLVIGLAGYGAVSLLPLIATLALHYLSGVFCTGLISLLVSGFPKFLCQRAPKVLARPVIRYSCYFAVVLFAARMAQVHLKNTSCVKEPGLLACELHPGLNAEASAAPDFVKAARSPETGGTLLRAFYRGMPEVSTGQPGVGRYDYIIHALGDDQREEYLKALQSTNPVFLRTPAQSNFIFSQWIWHQWPELWTWILERYRFETIWNGSSYWRRIIGDGSMPKRKLEAEIRSHDGKVEVTCLEAPAPGSLLALTISYRSKPVGGPLAGFVDRCTRVTVKGSGVLDSQSFSWPPGHGELMVKRLLLIPTPGAVPSVGIITEGPLLASELEIVGVEAEELKSEALSALQQTFQ
jgi:hypothetical protein